MRGIRGDRGDFWVLWVLAWGIYTVCGMDDESQKGGKRWNPNVLHMEMCGVVCFAVKG